MIFLRIHCPKLIILFLLYSVLCFASEENTVIIIGNRKETRIEGDAGQRISIQPKDVSQFDFGSHLKKQSNMSLARSGESSSSGYSQPKLRGQDSKITQLFIDDINLQSAHSSMPIFSDVDLRAFGKLFIHQGVSSFELPTTNPVGILQLGFRQGQKPAQLVGIQAGKPYGTSTWLRIDDSSESSRTKINSRLYYRNFYSDGKYQFYSDEGTPYDTSDDRLRTRLDNAQNSNFFLPRVELSNGSFRGGFFSIFSRKHREIPSVAGFDRTHAAEDRSDELTHVYVSYHVDEKNSLFPKNLVLFGTDIHQNAKMKDPEAKIQPLALGESELSLHSRSGGISATWRSKYFELKLLPSLNFCDLQTNSQKLHRKLHQIFVGASLKPFDSLVIEAKAQRKEFVDQSDDIKQEHRHETEGASGAIAYSFRRSRVFFQSAYDERSPSLLEVFGNGSSIIGASVPLKAEAIRHLELGFSSLFFNSALESHFTIFQDQTSNKIVFVPAAIPNSWHAINLLDTINRGVEELFVLNFPSETGISLGYTYLDARDRSEPGNEKLIPGLARHNFRSEVSQNLFDVKLRLLSRYRNTVYQDRRNTIELPGFWLFDASLDYTMNYASAQIDFGTMVENVLDQKSVKVKSSQNQNGRTGISDLSGYPLSGRSYQISLAARF